MATPSPEKKIAYKTFFALKDRLEIIVRLLCKDAQIFITNLYDRLKLVDQSVITCDNIGKMLFCHKLETFEAAFWTH